MTISRLHQQIAAVAPILGVAIGNETNKQTWRVDFEPFATQTERDAAAAVIQAFNINAPSPEDVNAERDRRMGAFSFGGKVYDLQSQSLANVSGAGTLALAALINGAQVGDLRWADPDADFTWIANDNTLVPMDAQTTWAFAQTAAAWRKHCIFKARALKDMSPIPSNYTADSHWE